MKKIFYTFFIAEVFGFSLFSQNISGIINIYTPVTAINNTTCTPNITVQSSGGFAVGDKVLIIQMKGAAIDISNTATFGTITSYGDCGNYEYNTIVAIAGNVITLQYSLLRTYTLTQYVQLVRVPVYNNANITGTLNAQNWNVATGTGGVLAFIDNGTTTFNANIDIRNSGFQGTLVQTIGWIGCSVNFIEPQAGIEALKGESIAILGASYTKGTGSPANGGGGGITDNGGGGASNFGTGGIGGQYGWQVSCSTIAQAGKPLTYSNLLNKIFLGGAGGDAQRSEGPGINMGVSGAGIVIMRTTGITGNNFSILAQGSNAATAIQDGGGAGGAGGTVLLDCPIYTGTLNVNTSGGNGGNAVYVGVKCSGGGGGGGGVLWVSTPAVPVNISYTSIGGAGGTSASPAINASPGSPGGSLTNLIIPQSNVAGSMTVTATPTNLKCNGQGIGTATVNITGGTAPFTYTWSNGQTTSTATGLSSGTYTVNVNDNGGCLNTMTVQITQPSALTVSVSATGAACNQANGSAAANVTGGTSGYIYSWNPSAQTTSTATGLSGGTYTVTITDANGCVATQTVNVTNSNALNSTLTQTNILCNGGTGTATVTPIGGTPSFVYSWNNGQTTSVATGLASGNYSVVITDASGCTSSNTVSITQPSALTVSVSATGATCNQANGSAMANVTGGTTGYIYSWNPSAQTTSTATGLTGGTYTVTITDANGCAVVNTVSVSSTPSVTAVAGPNSTICAGQTLTLSSSGGTNYSWSNGNTTSAMSVSPTARTTYSVIVSAGACSDTASVTVTVNPSPVIFVSGNTLLCKGDIATLSASGGTSYLWSNGSTTSVINVSPTATSTYTVVASNGNCTSSASVTVTVSPPPIASAINATICEGQNATLTASGGGTYSWSNGNTTSVINVSPTTNTSYSVIVSIGTCSDTAAASVVVNSNPTAIAWNNVTITAGSSITLSASGGQTYIWSNGSIGSVITVSPKINTGYCVTVSNGSCHDSACVTVYVEPVNCPAAEELYLPNAFSPNSDGENDVLKIYFKEIQCIKTFELHIYNRWGEKVFETTDPYFYWDGSYKGKIENTAVFVYYMKAVMTSGDKISRSGNVSLVR